MAYLLHKIKITIQWNSTPFKLPKCKPCTKVDVERIALLILRVMIPLNCYQGKSCVGGDYLLLLFFLIET